MYIIHDLSPILYTCVVRLQIENHDNCFYDYVEIRNGHSADSPLINKYCGYKLPLDVHSTTNKLYVKFLSDSSVQKAGFSATFMKGRYAVCVRACTRDGLVLGFTRFIPRGCVVVPK